MFLSVPLCLCVSLLAPVQGPGRGRRPRRMFGHGQPRGAAPTVSVRVAGVEMGARVGRHAGLPLQVSVRVAEVEVGARAGAMNRAPTMDVDPESAKADFVLL